MYENIKYPPPHTHTHPGCYHAVTIHVRMQKIPSGLGGGPEKVLSHQSISQRAVQMAYMNMAELLRRRQTSIYMKHLDSRHPF